MLTAKLTYAPNKATKAKAIWPVTANVTESDKKRKRKDIVRITCAIALFLVWLCCG